MPSKQKFIAIAIIILSILLVAALVAGYFYSKKEKLETNQNTNTKTNQVVNTNKTTAGNTNNAVATNESIANTNTEQASKTEDEQKAITKSARFFTERFGTYSNENNFSNLTSLKDYMTGEMQTWTDNFIAQNKDKNKDVYYSLVSQAVSSNITEYNEEAKTAKAEVVAMQEETTGLPQKVITKDRTLMLELKKEGNAWKVNSAQWR
ncbi:MAG: hypothetical protein WC752_02040 [Patescibacteria group bacterium]|jgi:FtsZ-interacting cell division protein ZipA